MQYIDSVVGGLASSFFIYGRFFDKYIVIGTFKFSMLANKIRSIFHQILLFCLGFLLVTHIDLVNFLCSSRIT